MGKTDRRTNSRETPRPPAVTAALPGSGSAFENAPRPPVITLLTDFGDRDGYVASMKGVILSICPEARIVDITHMIVPQDVRSGAFVLGSVFGYFPNGTIHLAVVDPGVGTERGALAIRTPHCFLVGPDNGLFSEVLDKEAELAANTEVATKTEITATTEVGIKAEVETKVKTFGIENPAYWRSPVSSTFHGRDIFAPVAAHLASGVPIDMLGPRRVPSPPPWKPVTVSADRLEGEIIHIDRFGNGVTNISRAVLEAFASTGKWTLRVRGETIAAVASAYAERSPGTCMALMGSSGYLEIAINQGSAAERLELRRRDSVALHRDE